MVAVIFVPKHLFMLIIMHHTNTGDREVPFTLNPMRRTIAHSSVEVVMLLTLCTNFQVFARFACCAVVQYLCNPIHSHSKKSKSKVMTYDDVIRATNQRRELSSGLGYKYPCVSHSQSDEIWELQGQHLKLITGITESA